MKICDDVARSVGRVAVVLKGCDERASKEVVALAWGLAFVLGASTEVAAEKVGLLKHKSCLSDEEIVIVSWSETGRHAGRGVAGLEVQRGELYAAVLCFLGSDIVVCQPL